MAQVPQNDVPYTNLLASYENFNQADMDDQERANHTEQAQLGLQAKRVRIRFNPIALHRRSNCNERDYEYDAAENTRYEQRKSMVLYWINQFLEFNQLLSERIVTNFDGEEVLEVFVFTEPDSSGEDLKVYTATKANYSIYLRASERYLRGEDVDNNMYRHPIYDLDALLHEFMHVVNHAARKSIAGDPESPDKLGVEEAFCDLFAMQFTETIKEEEYLRSLLGPVMAFKWQAVDELTVKTQEGNRIVLSDVSRDDFWEKCTSGGGPREYAKRDYHVFLSPNTVRKKDPHFHGRMLTKGLLNVRENFREDNVFFREMWSFFLNRTVRYTVIACIEKLMEWFAGAVRDNPDDFPEEFRTVDQLLTLFVNAWTDERQSSTNDDLKLVADNIGNRRVRTVLMQVRQRLIEA